MATKSTSVNPSTKRYLTLLIVGVLVVGIYYATLYDGDSLSPWLSVPLATVSAVVGVGLTVGGAVGVFWSTVRGEHKIPREKS